MVMKHTIALSEGSLYPTHPPDSRILVSIPGHELSIVDRTMVMLSSLMIVGSVAWVPSLYAWAWKRWKTIPKEQTRRRLMYATLLLSLAAIAAVGPHRSSRVGEWLKARKWTLWRAWLKFVAFEVVADSSATSFDFKNEKAIIAISPHGVFPFALALAALPEQASEVFGYFQPVVATATSLFPFVNTILCWLKKIDASRSAVDRSLAQGARIGLAPGGIAEMFEGYPKPGTHPDEEYVIINSRKGFIRLAIKHGVPVVPVFCFGVTKMLSRMQLPVLFEQVSNLLRVSICIFYGAFGLPIPFRQKLLYVMGDPIFPLTSYDDDAALNHQVDLMHSEFCTKLTNLFERHKRSYGWDRKTLKLI